MLSGNELRGIKQIRCVEVLRDSENNVISLEALQRDFDIQKSSVDTLVKKGIAEIFEEEAEFCVNTYNEFEKQGGTYPVHELNEEQVKAFNNIKECIKNNDLDENFHITPKENDLYSRLTIDDINELNQEANLKRIQIITPDGPANYLRKTLNKMDEETFDLFIKYHLSTCERMDLIGAAAHTLDILKK